MHVPHCICANQRTTFRTWLFPFYHEFQRSNSCHQAFQIKGFNQNLAALDSFVNVDLPVLLGFASALLRYQFAAFFSHNLFEWFCSRVMGAPQSNWEVASSCIFSKVYRELISSPPLMSGGATSEQVCIWYFLYYLLTQFL